ncbi:YIP1 family protein [Halobaculum sp. D14]|uniref:YIP1 family protein n=1 Tax=Halobaculum sp. D14 TaxID=3421642 RepID=UPI003EBEE2E5
MTTWVDNPEGGRARGPRGVARAWVEVMVRPTRFFGNGVSPGDQAPGLVFASTVATCFLVGRFLTAPETVPTTLGGPALSSLVALVAVAVFVAPAALHLTAAVQTVLLVVASLDFDRERGLYQRERAGISQTVQVVAYAAAPCALAGPAVPSLRAACALYATALLALGVRTVHGTTTGRAVAATAIPAAMAFGVGFGGFEAVATLLARWYII